MEINTRNQEKIAVIAVVGSIDALTAGQVSSHLATQISSGYSQVLLDLSGVDYMSSAGLRSIMDALKACRQAGGDLRLAAPQPGVEKVLRMAGFPSIMKSYASLDEALSSFKD